MVQFRFKMLVRRSLGVGGSTSVRATPFVKITEVESKRNF